MRVENGSGWLGDVRAEWPRSISDLTDTTRCPACFTPLRSAVCSRCGLDLSGAHARELADLSGLIARQLNDRAGLIGHMAEAAQKAAVPAQAVPAHTVPAQSAPAQAAPAQAAPITAPSAPVASPPAAAAPVRPGATPRRSGVQIALLITGISLLSVFAIFFLIYAFINYGLVWRSTIIAVVTVAAFVAASMLRKRRLTASAEAIAVFALLLVYLDAFAIRANSLGGADRIDGRAYWGLVLVGSAIAFILWHRVAGVRAASIVGYSLFAPGVGVLVSALSRSGDSYSSSSTTAFIISIAVALGSLIQMAALAVPEKPGRSASLLPERVIAGATGLIALLLAALFGLTLPASQIPAPVPLAICAGTALLIAVAHSAALRARPSSHFDRVSSIVFAGASGAALAVGAATSTISDRSDESITFIAPALAFGVTVVLLLIRNAVTAQRAQANAAVFAAAGVSALAILPAAFIAVGHWVTFLGDAVDLDPVSSGAAARMPFALVLYSVAALTLAVATTALCLRLVGRFRSALPWLLPSGVAVLLVALTLLPSVWFVLTASTALGTVGLVVLRRMPRSYSAAARTAALGGFATTWLAGWLADDTWLPATIVTVAALVVARIIVCSAAWARALVTGGAVSLSLIGIAYGGWLLAPAGSGNAALTSAAAVAILAGALSAVAALDLGWITTLERRLVWWVTFAALLASAIVWAIYPAENAPPSISLLVFAGASVTAAATALWSIASPLVERFCAALLIAPAFAVALNAAAHLAVPGGLPAGLDAAVAAALIAALALVWTAAPRRGVDIGVALTALLALTVAIGSPNQTGWIVLLVCAVTAAIAASSRDGLVSSRAPRRHLGWLALFLAIAALWWALTDAGISAIEPFVLPPAASLIAIAVLIRIRRNASLSAAQLLFWGLVLAIVPIGLASSGTDTSDLVRAAVVVLVSAILLVVGSAVLSRSQNSAPTTADAALGHTEFSRLAAAAVASAGLVGTALVTLLRAGEAISSPAGVLEMWLAPSVCALILCAAFVSRREQLTAGKVTISGPKLGQALVVAAIATAALYELGAVIATPEGSPVGASLRVVVVVAALSAIHVAAFARRVPLAAAFGSPAAWTAIGFAGVAALVGLAYVEAPEMVTAPVALALIVTGALRLSRNPRSGSWPALGPGLALLLLPTLLLTFTDPVVWRLVALGIVGVATIVAGVALRLQAPFIIGTVVVLVHALRTFAPQIVAIYEAADWYVWAGIGGVLLVAIAIRYEHRMRDVKRAVGSIASLR
ncbi:SCO7613 C-terminal domain-containing membrane protein [Salinibacterium hongtaonis]|uniref:SCO7613 C-terminal domain-containing membrane protein n=1 Tax=Homoserinimonas hongtaonis TaxID=2079791 RepID=UPI000D3433C2|nr:hypothetical protein [Salinibacterium hongtaonis]AWB89495.1 hypothetical protein C2138_08035 [Salinibacterium hongtaonis]